MNKYLFIVCKWKCVNVVIFNLDNIVIVFSDINCFNSLSSNLRKFILFDYKNVFGCKIENDKIY